mgnify:FL=1
MLNADTERRVASLIHQGAAIQRKQNAAEESMRERVRASRAAVAAHHLAAATSEAPAANTASRRVVPESRRQMPMAAASSAAPSPRLAVRVSPFLQLPSVTSPLPDDVTDEPRPEAAEGAVDGTPAATAKWDPVPPAAAVSPSQRAPSNSATEEDLRTAQHELSALQARLEQEHADRIYVERLVMMREEHHFRNRLALQERQVFETHLAVSSQQLYLMQLNREHTLSLDALQQRLEDSTHISRLRRELQDATRRVHEEREAVAQLQAELRERDHNRRALLDHDRDAWALERTQLHRRIAVLEAAVEALRVPQPAAPPMPTSPAPPAVQAMPTTMPYDSNMASSHDRAQQQTWSDERVQWRVERETWQRERAELLHQVNNLKSAGPATGMTSGSPNGSRSHPPAPHWSEATGTTAATSLASPRPSLSSPFVPPAAWNVMPSPVPQKPADFHVGPAQAAPRNNNSEDSVGRQIDALSVRVSNTISRAARLLESA